MTWLRRLAQNRLLDAGALLIAVLAAVKIAVVLPKQVVEYDFAHYYVWSRLLIEGDNPYLARAEPLYVRYGFVSYKDRPTATNPPPLLWLFAPFALLTPPRAFAGWFLVQASSLYAILWLTRRLLQQRLSARGWRFVCAGAVASQAVYLHFCFGQVQLLLAALLLAAYALHRRGRDTSACLLMTAAGLLKVYPFVLLPWFLWRGGGGTRARAGRAILVLGVAVLVIWITDIQMWQNLIQNALPVVTHYAMGPSYNFSLPSFVANLGCGVRGFTSSVAEAHIWWIVGEAAGVALIVLTYIACWRRGGEAEAEFCLLCVAMLAGNMVVWGHYFVFLIFPMAAAATRLATQPTAASLTVLALLLVMLNDLNAWVPAALGRTHYLRLLIQYVPLYGLLGLGLLFFGELRSTR